ncbi:hypothetical protein EXIGLDRAFT_448205 [Exidia glandulosa HHB12029]|uniref:Uncharacterized protein n=1 Tax=Exidia glandulosa HHB12029 TaxID=1314781 RepID=A0A165B4W6_EXIGL|nr:hypothetical protein EXIGLDRAFT_448205 [Exidia glandulosa HHB12029]
MQIRTSTFFPAPARAEPQAGPGNTSPRETPSTHETRKQRRQREFEERMARQRQREEEERAERERERSTYYSQRTVLRATNSACRTIEEAGDGLRRLVLR